MKRFLKVVLWASIVLMGGCGQVEFPKNTLSPVKPPKDTTQYQLGFTDIMEFKEGEFSEYQINPKVPESGVPVVTVTGLPKGAQFNSTTMRVSWAVPIGFINSVPHESNGTAILPLEIHLRAEGDPVDVLVRQAKMWVKP